MYLTVLFISISGRTPFNAYLTVTEEPRRLAAIFYVSISGRTPFNAYLTVTEEPRRLAGIFFSLVKMICRVSLSPQYFIYNHKRQTYIYNKCFL